MAQLQATTTARSAVAAGLLALVLLATAAPAHAGRYHVYSCRTPAGQPLVADGWVGSVAPANAYYSHVEDTCGTSGALIASLSDEIAHPVNEEIATWAFVAPAVDPLVAAALWRAGDTDGGTANGTGFEFSLSSSTGLLAFDKCISSGECTSQGDMQVPLSAANRVTDLAVGSGQPIYVSATCVGEADHTCQEGKGDPNGYAAVVYLYAADLILEQSAGPTVGFVGGELASAAAVSGTSDVTFTATDPGAGVYEAVVSVDGNVVRQEVLDENEGKCRNLGETTDGLAAFAYVQPCAQSLSATVGLDTTTLGNGQHRVAVSVVDAAGNSAQVLEREITVANPVAPPAPPGPGPANGANASAAAALAVSWQHTTNTHLTIGYGHAETVDGRLTAPGGVPISGARIEVQATDADAGASTVALPAAITDGNGRFTVRLAAGVCSRALRFSYRAHVGDATPAVARSLTLSVHAGIALTIAPRTASVGRSIYFHGRVLGGPIPKDGKQLVLEARSPGGPWIEFDVVRSDAHGRYRSSYRFKFAGPASYQFRALSEPESDYPFLAGASRVVSVYER